MDRIPHSLKRLRRFHLLSNLTVICLIAAIGVLTWVHAQREQTYRGRQQALYEQINAPYSLMQQLQLLTAGETQPEAFQQQLSLWIERQEALLKGNERYGILQAADEEIRTAWQPADAAFRQIAKELKSAPGNDERISAGLASLSAFAPAYERQLHQMMEMWKQAQERMAGWTLTLNIFLIIAAAMLILLESVFITKPMLQFLYNNIKRREIFKLASDSHNQIINELAGQVEAKPALGKVSRQEEAPENLADQYPMKIMIVEDHPANQKYLQKLFTKLGYQPELASNGKEAVAKAVTHQFDMIFMDIQMPVMDGIQASYEILNDKTGQDQPIIIALTGSAEPETQEQCLDVGMKDIIWKPVKREQVTEAIVKWCRVPQAG